ncbi:hypothetical protein [Pseudogemmobacter faecipullorum]|uniref:Uncharacterized protein n=1 Tax=Pseudogemmobacter faecipullorum TaxID=2755041 RepID=A0ABS8CQK5_9RHOB|nr:hypothetical protein [Pseudogemmobacter faecipullorum]MCB5411676.1 hypothetical protein [Pseudogemmobacter faecipullorum]
MSRPELSYRELATILAALRLWQRTDNRAHIEESVIATDCETMLALDNDEIDALCERLNA